MFGLGWFEVFVILIVALLVIGPDKLPEVARGLAKFIRQFQRLSREIRNSINLEDFEAKLRDSSHYTPPIPEMPERIKPNMDEHLQPGEAIQGDNEAKVTPITPVAASPNTISANKDDSPRS